MGNKFSRLLLRLVIFLVLVLQIQPGSGQNETSVVKLRVGVPQKTGFPEFVHMVWDRHLNQFNVSGFCMDVFNAVTNRLPFNVSLQIEAYHIDESLATYNALLEMLPENKFDVVVGDVTILANRSKYVDFTLPYTETGVRMLVPVQHGRQKTMWIFVRPFSWGLWLSVVLISLCIGSVILIMERNVKAMPDQQGSTKAKQLSPIAILWFPISLAVLPEREAVVKNCSRFVLMVWLLLSFVLMQSYTANLTSILTLDQLQPSVMSVEELIKGDHYVGYQIGSFVGDMLVQKWKIPRSKLKPYGDGLDAYHKALKLGSQGGGVSAIIDEIPYLRLFLRKYGSNYVMTGPTYRTDGLGFAFQYNSNLTSHFSRAVLNVTESEIMDEIEQKYFGKKDTIVGGDYSDQSAQLSSSSPSSPSLTFHSFSGLFLIAGIAIFLALVISESVLWQRSFRWLKAKTYSQSCFPTQTQVHPNQDSTLQGIQVV